MSTHRFNEVPINLDRLTDVERSNLRGYLEERVATATGELAVLNAYEAPELPLDNLVEFPQPELPMPPTAA